MPAVGTESVSVVIPCYNEERYIAKTLENLAEQYDPEHYEIIVVDGMSEDRTREVVADFQKRHPQVAVKLIDNPAQGIPSGLNLGIAAARGEIIARIDAHAIASQNYIRRCVEVLHKGEAAIVGMPCRVCPGDDTLIARAIALAVSHPFGIGDARYRLASGSAPQETVDTVAFACFKKSLWKELGGFNEDLLTNEDYDFNYRARLSGGRVLLDRSGHCDYFARSTVRGLAAQYFRYGQWKARMVKMHPRSIKLRHTAAPAFVASIVLLTAIGFLWNIGEWLLLLEAATYFLVAVLFGAQAVRRARGRFLVILILPIVFFSIHVTWGTSFLLGLARPTRIIAVKD